MLPFGTPAPMSGTIRSTSFPRFARSQLFDQDHADAHRDVSGAHAGLVHHQQDNVLPLKVFQVGRRASESARSLQAQVGFNVLRATSECTGLASTSL